MAHRKCSKSFITILAILVIIITIIIVLGYYYSLNEEDCLDLPQT